MRCEVFTAYDGRTIDRTALLLLGENGTEILPGPKTGRRTGFGGSGSVANALSHIRLAKHFLMQKEEGLGKLEGEGGEGEEVEGKTLLLNELHDEFDCFFMLEDDATVSSTFVEDLDSLLHHVEQLSHGKWDVVNLKGKGNLTLLNIACAMFVRTVAHGLYTWGSFTHSAGLVFSRRGLEKFISLLPVDTHIDLFLSKHVSAGLMDGYKTCAEYVGKAPEESGLKSTKLEVNHNEGAELTEEDWRDAFALYHTTHEAD